MTKQPVNIVISGKMGAGKSEIAKGLREMLGYKIVSIAAPMYKIATYIAARDKNSLFRYLEQLNKSHLSESYEDLMKDYDKATYLTNSDGSFKKTDSFRGLLQDVAQIARNAHNDGVWAWMMVDDLKEMEPAQHVICDDVRHPMEKDILEHYGFKTVRLDVSPEEQKRRLMAKYGEVSQEKLNHITETALDDEVFDVRLFTDNMTPREIVSEILKQLDIPIPPLPTVLSDIVNLTRSIPLGKRDDWIEYFMSVAYIVSLRSTCGSRRVGAVLVDGLESGKRRILATGYNGYPSGATHCIDGGCPRFAAKMKSGSSFNDTENPCHAFHAEHNVFNQILTSNVDSEGCILFCTTHPCINCARMIHGAKVKAVYYAEGYPDDLAKQYFEQFNIPVYKVNI